MAMGAAVVATPEAFHGIRARAGQDLLVADSEAAFAHMVGDVLAGRHCGLGPSARRAMVPSYDWESTLSALDELPALRAAAPVAA
jgi:hypothetical protein